MHVHRFPHAILPHGNLSCLHNLAIFTSLPIQLLFHSWSLTHNLSSDSNSGWGLPSPTGLCLAFITVLSQVLSDGIETFLYDIGSRQQYSLWLTRIRANSMIFNRNGRVVVLYLENEKLAYATQHWNVVVGGVGIDGGGGGGGGVCLCARTCGGVGYWGWSLDSCTFWSTSPALQCSFKYYSHHNNFPNKNLSGCLLSFGTISLPFILPPARADGVLVSDGRKPFPLLNWLLTSSFWFSQTCCLTNIQSRVC